MFECLGHFLRCLWCCIMNSLRFLLIIATLATTIAFSSCIALAIYNSRNGMIDRFPRVKLQSKVFLLIISYLVVSVIGALGSIFNAKFFLKSFTILTVINLLLLIVGVIFVVPKGLIARYNDNYMAQLKQDMVNYDWKCDLPPEGSHPATVVWDNLQSGLMCCGLEGPQDWAQYRPIEVGANTLPKSCCLRPTITTIGQTSTNQTTSTSGEGKILEEEPWPLCIEGSESTFKFGCHEQMRRAERLILLLLLPFLGLQSIMSFIAWCLAHRHGYVAAGRRPNHHHHHHHHHNLSSQTSGCTARGGEGGSRKTFCEQFDVVRVPLSSPPAAVYYGGITVPLHQQPSETQAIYPNLLPQTEATQLVRPPPYNPSS